MKERWYRADFKAIIDGEEYYPDSDYYCAKNDDEAVKIGKRIAADGWDYEDVPEHVSGELITVTLLDDEDDFKEIRPVWE